MKEISFVIHYPQVSAVTIWSMNVYLGLFLLRCYLRVTRTCFSYPCSWPAITFNTFTPTLAEIIPQRTQSDTKKNCQSMLFYQRVYDTMEESPLSPHSKIIPDSQF